MLDVNCKKVNCFFFFLLKGKKKISKDGNYFNVYMFAYKYVFIFREGQRKWMREDWILWMLQYGNEVDIVECITEMKNKPNPTT